MRRAIRESVRLFAASFEPDGPVIEVGSLYLPGYQELSDLRPLFADLPFTGCDARQGPGVDRIEDAHALSFADGSAGTMVMCEILEHLPRPQRAVDEAHRVLCDGGLFVLSVPFDHALHAFPADYWRFTPSGIAILLSEFPQKAIFALGPRVKPQFVFAVAAKGGYPAFAERKAHFVKEVERSFRGSRRRGRASVLKVRSREMLGFLTGRADLSVQFFDGPAEVGYPGAIWK